MPLRGAKLTYYLKRKNPKLYEKAIERKAREYGVPVTYVNPKNTSRKCSKGEKLRHRDVVACWNFLFKALRGLKQCSHHPRRTYFKWEGCAVALDHHSRPLRDAQVPRGAPKQL